MPEYKKEWLDKASLDYFAPFILAWLGFNSWYRSHYSELAAGTDRDIINRLKTDFTRRNQPYSKCQDLMGRRDKIATEFQSDIEMLYRAFIAAALTPEKLKYLGLHKALIDYSQKNNEGDYIKLIKTGQRTKSADWRKFQHGLLISSDDQIIFSGLLECIYQFRHMLIHGHIEPTNENHDIAKYCHNVLLALMD